MIAVKVQKPDLPRAFVFEVQVGFSKAEPQVDPLSGMVINLVYVDQILAELASLWKARPWRSLKELLQGSQEFLASRAEKEGVFLEEICLLEKRKFWLKWRAGELWMGREVLRELQEQVYRLRYESPFEESRVESQEFTVEKPKDLLSEKVFSEAGLKSLEIENLGTGEKWSLHSF